MTASSRSFSRTSRPSLSAKPAAPQSAQKPRRFTKGCQYRRVAQDGNRTHDLLLLKCEYKTNALTTMLLRPPHVAGPRQSRRWAPLLSVVVRALCVRCACAVCSLYARHNVQRHGAPSGCNVWRSREGLLGGRWQASVRSMLSQPWFLWALRAPADSASICSRRTQHSLHLHVYIQSQRLISPPPPASLPSPMGSGSASPTFLPPTAYE